MKWKTKEGYNLHERTWYTFFAGLLHHISKLGRIAVSILVYIEIATDTTLTTQSVVVLSIVLMTWGLYPIILDLLGNFRFKYVKEESPPPTSNGNQ